MRLSIIMFLTLATYLSYGHLLLRVQYIYTSNCMNPGEMRIASFLVWPSLLEMAIPFRVAEGQARIFVATMEAAGAEIRKH